MADLLGLSTTAYGDIERGKTDLTLSRLNQIGGVFNLSLLALMSDTDWKRRYEERLTWELARAATNGTVRDRIGF